MLAQSAALGGFRTYAIDFFADSDTRQYTERCIAVRMGAKGFDEGQLLDTIKDFAPPHRDCALVYGSGIDNRPLLVEKLTMERILFGNKPVTLKQINSAQVFFGLLDRLGIPYPETRFTLPDRGYDGIVKSDCGEGGKDIRFFSANSLPIQSDYYQRLVPGDAYSLLFLANGMESRVIGFNTQWTATHEPTQPFLFAGAINRTDLTETQCSEVEEYAAKLTAASGLVGLNSLDFVLANGVCQVLEINPRPSATMALYDEDFTQGLLALHIAACHGELPPPIRHNGTVRAMRTVFSNTATKIPVGFRWPEGCTDIPNSGTTISAGQPVCGLVVRGKNRQEAEILVKLLENEILGSLPPFAKGGQGD